MREWVESEPLDIDETDEQAWERFDDLALDADERGVLNYYNINRGRDLPYHEQANDEAVEMSKADVCNVEFLKFGELDVVLDDIIGVVETQHEMEYLNCRWNIAADIPQTTRDVVAFRSKRK